MFCDNESICQIINSGKTPNEILQNCLREIAFLAAVHEFQIKSCILIKNLTGYQIIFHAWNQILLIELNFLMQQNNLN